jgi:hypothetical protein
VTQRVVKTYRHGKRAKCLPCIRSLQIEGPQEFIFDLTADMPKLWPLALWVRSAQWRDGYKTSIFATRLRPRDAGHSPTAVAYWMFSGTSQASRAADEVIEYGTRTSAFGTTAKCRLRQAMSAFGGKAENICSVGAFRILTRRRHLRCPSWPNILYDVHYCNGSMSSQIKPRYGKHCASRARTRTRKTAAD